MVINYEGPVKLILTLDRIFFASLIISFVESFSPNASLKNVKFSMVKSPESTEKTNKYHFTASFCKRKHTQKTF